MDLFLLAGVAAPRSSEIGQRDRRSGRADWMLVESLGYKKWGVGQLVDDPASFVRRGGSIPRTRESLLQSPSSTGRTGLA